MPAVSVVVCTYDRPSSLARTLTSLRRQTFPSARFEVVVVDNGSSAGAARVAGEHDEGPAVRYVREPRPGLSGARNRGVTETGGELVAFLDDDAVADPGWLEALVGAARTGLEVAAVGGPVRLVWPTPRPAWLPPRVDRQLSGLDLGGERRPMVYPEAPIGTNMCIRREALRAVGGFSPQLGRRGSSLLSNEELELFARLHRRGAMVLYEPAAVVDHHLGPERTSPAWLIRRYFSQGRSTAILERLTTPVERGEWARRAGSAAWRAAFRGKRPLVASAGPWEP